MLVSTNSYNPFQNKKISKVPISTRAINPGKQSVQIIVSKPMTIRKTRRRPKQTELEFSQKCVDDFKFTPLEISWLTDYDICEVHDKVMKYLKSKIEREETLKKTIKSFNEFSSKKSSAEDICIVYNKVKVLEAELEELEKISVLDYIVNTKDLVEEYRSLSVNVARIFGEKVITDVVTNRRKTEIILSYLEISKYYCPMNISRVVRSGGLCSCGGSIIDDDEQYRCSECNIILKKIENPPEVTDQEDTYSSRSGYQRNINYKDIVLQFQGTFPITIPDKVLDSISTAVASYQDFDIKKINKYDLYRIMKEQNLGGWYKHINRIHFELTEIKPPDISQYESKLFIRGDLLNTIYDEIKADSRSNFMHGLYLLWLYLKNEGYEPNDEDFVMLKGRDVEVNNIDILERGFDILSKTHPEMKWKIYQLP